MKPQHLATAWRTFRAWQRDQYRLVSQSTAESRAQVCVRCPLNVDKQNVATRLLGHNFDPKEFFAVLQGRHTPQDDRLHICDACDCIMRLKIWLPLSIIKDYMPHETIQALDLKCWILHESPQT